MSLTTPGAGVVSADAVPLVLRRFLSTEVEFEVDLPSGQTLRFHRRADEAGVSNWSAVPADALVQTRFSAPVRHATGVHSRNSPAHNVLIARGKRSGRPRMSRTDLPDAPIVLARAGAKVLLKAEDRIFGTLSGLAPKDPHGADLTDFRMVVWHRVCTPASGN
jgi:hypothetical protein